jgi:hypothetical protein
MVESESLGEFDDMIIILETAKLFTVLILLGLPAKAVDR